MHAFTPSKVGQNSRTPQSPQNPEDSQIHNPEGLIFSQPLLSQDAVRLWTCV